MNQSRDDPLRLGTRTTAATTRKQRKRPLTMRVGTGGSVVVDASFAVKWVLPEQYSDQAVELLRKWKADKIWPVAPTLLAVEVANAIYKRVRRGELSSSEGKAALSTLLGAGVIFQRDQHLCLEAWDIARRLNLPATYDAVYLALALALRCPLWTGNQRLYHSVKGELIWVRWVGEPRGK